MIVGPAHGISKTPKESQRHSNLLPQAGSPSSFLPCRKAHHKCPGTTCMVSSLSTSHPEGNDLFTWLFQVRRHFLVMFLSCMCVCTPRLHVWKRPSQPMSCRKGWDASMLGWGNRSVPWCNNNTEINIIHSFYPPVHIPHFLWESLIKMFAVIYKASSNRITFASLSCIWSRDSSACNSALFVTTLPWRHFSFQVPSKLWKSTYNSMGL